MVVAQAQQPPALLQNSQHPHTPAAAAHPPQVEHDLEQQRQLWVLLQPLPHVWRQQVDQLQNLLRLLCCARAAGWRAAAAAPRRLHLAGAGGGAAAAAGLARPRCRLLQPTGCGNGSLGAGSKLGQAGSPGSSGPSRCQRAPGCGPPAGDAGGASCELGSLHRCHATQSCLVQGPPGRERCPSSALSQWNEAQAAVDECDEDAPTMRQQCA